MTITFTQESRSPSESWLPKQTLCKCGHYHNYSPVCEGWIPVETPPDTPCYGLIYIPFDPTWGPEESLVAYWNGELWVSKRKPSYWQELPARPRVVRYYIDHPDPDVLSVGCHTLEIACRLSERGVDSVSERIEDGTGDPPKTGRFWDWSNEREEWVETFSNIRKDQ